MFDQVIAGAPGDRHDAERRVLVRIGDKRRAVGKKKIRDFPGLTVLIQHRRFRIRTHSRAAHFVNHFMSGGACLIDAEGVVEIRINDTLAIP